MTEDPNNWQENNQRYLSAALEWLRLKLRAMTHQSGERVTRVESEPALRQHATGNKWRFWNKHESAPGQPRALLLPAPDGSLITGEQVTCAAEELEAAEAVTPPPAMVLLGNSFGLSRFEKDILLLCAAMELDTRIASLCAEAQGNTQRTYPTFALAMSLFDDPAWSALSPEGPLRHWRLIEINQPGAQPLTTSALRADERIVNFLKGLNYLDDRLATLLLPMTPLDGIAPHELPASQQRTVEAILRSLHQARRAAPVIQLVGADAASKQLIAEHVVAALGLRLYRLPAEMIPTQSADLETLARLAERETALWPLAIYLEANEVHTEAKSDSVWPSINRFLARNDGLVFLDARDPRRELSREAITVDVTRPTPAEQSLAWAAALGPGSEETAASLASQFNLSLATIGQVASSETAEPDEDPARRSIRLWDECLAATRPGLERLAERIEPKASWDDIVLPDAEMKLLAQIAAQVRNRGRVYEAGGFAASRSRGLSINALFTGESGTGKTMAAEVLANELRVSLYRIDLSAVVNKYIGETEKNLRRLFDAAEDGGAILFFDEADALFGKRSEVNDAHDRYANIEVAYLLQKIEEYEGVVILASNLSKNIDLAFARRLCHGQCADYTTPTRSCARGMKCGTKRRGLPARES